MKYLILNEKPSAMKNFAKALGGQAGQFDGFNYQLVCGHGHLLGLDSPQNQSSDVNFQDKVKYWSDTSTIPWPLADFKWKKTYLPSINFRTKRKTTTKGDVQNIKQAAQGCDVFVIATDDDPSGEGDVLGQEIVNAIGWKKKVYRCRFADESAPSIKKALKNLDDVSDQTQNGNYQKGLAREQFDYATMQLSRLATRYAREQSYDVVVRPGRLKSTIVEKIYQQTHSRDTFVAKDQYQAIFMDENKTKFINKELSKYESRDLAENDLSQLRPSAITIGQAEHKTKKAPKMLDFAQVGVALGYTKAPLKQIVSTYQKLYQDGYVSYPRTEDRAMTKEQWSQLLTIADKIAEVVNVDSNLLVNRDPRSPYVSSKDLSHGANRPGLTVPTSLTALNQKYGKLAGAIYETLAKSYLACLGPDYEYDKTTAFVTDYPKFTATKNVPDKPGYKAILGSLEQKSKKKDDENDEADFGQTATPTINQTKTTPPQKPTRKFILNYLTKHEVGTGATRMNTLSQLLEGKKAVLKEQKGQLVLIPEGMLSGAMLQSTMLATPKVTKQLTQMTKQVGQGKIPLTNIYKAVNLIIQKDDAQMKKNAKSLDQDSYLKGKLPPKSANSQAKFHGKLADGTEVSFKKNFMHHEFTDPEVEALLAGQAITIEIETKNGQKKRVAGKLAHQSFTGKDHKKVKYWGFKPDWGRRV